MEGTSHPAPPTGGFRKTGNGEQYAFKKVNIEECHSHLYVSNLLPAGGAMSITEHSCRCLQSSTFKTYEVWCRLNIMFEFVKQILLSNRWRYD